MVTLKQYMYSYSNIIFFYQRAALRAVPADQQMAWAQSEEKEEVGSAEHL